jgi:hypothetical protein
MDQPGPGKDLPDRALVRAVVLVTEIACFVRRCPESSCRRRARGACQDSRGGRWGGALGPPTGPGRCGRGPGGPVLLPQGHPGQHRPGSGHRRRRTDLGTHRRLTRWRNAPLAESWPVGHATASDQQAAHAAHHALGGMTERFWARRGLYKYAGHARPCAVDARDARKTDEAIRGQINASCRAAGPPGRTGAKLPAVAWDPA